MELNYKTKEGRLFTSNGAEVMPDSNGIVTVVINGSTRRFILSKFIAKLESGTEIKLANVAGKVGNRRGSCKDMPEGKVKTPKPEKPKRKVPIVAMDKDGNKQTFASQVLASKALGISKSNICQQMSGMYKQIGGYIFWKQGEPEKTWPVYDTNHGGKPVIALIDGKKKEYKSASAAAIHLGISKGGVSKAISRNKPTKGYQFKFKTA